MGAERPDHPGRVQRPSRNAQWRGAVLTVLWLFPALWALTWGVMAVTP